MWVRVPQPLLIKEKHTFWGVLFSVSYARLTQKVFAWVLLGFSLGVAQWWGLSECGGAIYICFALCAVEPAVEINDEGVKDGAAGVEMAVVVLGSDQGGGNAGGVDAVGLGNVGGGGVVSGLDRWRGGFAVGVAGMLGHKLILIRARMSLMLRIL